ncbi:MAG: hypothetical protein L6R19_14075 [Alphaproteobacteria bacterium]|nr:hypothetical protein [Alphaproteobacteria bacterium]
MKPGPLAATSTSIVTVRGTAARAERVRRVEETSHRFRTEVEPRHGAYGRFEARWSQPLVDDPRTMAQLTQPRGAFLAQLIAQEELGPGLTLDDAAAPLRAYRRAARKPVEIRAGATVDLAA